MKIQAPAPASGKMFEAARDLRQRQTPAEALLWAFLRRNQLGVPFRRQHVIGPVVTDFCCPNVRLVVEVDGSVHNDPDAQKQDARRTRELNEMGFTVIRFSNIQVFDDPRSVVRQIQAVLDQRT